MTEPSAPPTPNQPPLRLHARTWINFWTLFPVAACAVGWWLWWEGQFAAVSPLIISSTLMLGSLLIGAVGQYLLYHFQQRVRIEHRAGRAVDDRDVAFLFRRPLWGPPKIPGPEAHPTGFAVRTHARAVLMKFVGLAAFYGSIFSIGLISSIRSGVGFVILPWLCLIAGLLFIRWYTNRLNTRELPGPNDCQHCGYRAVRALESRRCPECGMVVEDGAVLSNEGNAPR